MADLHNFNTLSDVITESYNELAEDSNSSVPGLGQSEMEKWANRFAKWFLEKVRLKSQEESTSYEAVADTTLSAAASSGAGTVDLTSVTGLPTGGGLIVLDNIPYEYDSIASTTVTLSGTLERDFESGATVQPAYALPTDFGRPRFLSVEGEQYMYQRWGIDDTVAPKHFSVFKGFIILPKARTADDKITLHYFSKAANTLASTDTMEIYEMWDAYVVYMLTARGHRLLYDDNRAVMYEDLAKQVLAKAKTAVATESDEINGNAVLPGW